MALQSGLARGSDEPAVPPAIDITDPLPYGQRPIDYAGPETDDPVARRLLRLENSPSPFEHTETGGYLASLLDAFDVPVESQTLVYSKTALNQNLIGPKRPRAIYFNDEIYVAWVPGAASLEIAAVDPLKGGIFYEMSQRRDEPPRIHRNDRCIACHLGNTTLHVPGFIVRSFQTDDLGSPLAGYSRITHASPVENRFGGWYVTAAQGPSQHLGNLVGRDDNDRNKRDPDFRGTLPDLKPLFDVSLHLSPASDVVAHLVLQHQAHGQNLLFRAGYESRLGRRSDVEDQLLRYLLFVDEAPLPGPIQGNTGYARWFERQGSRDPAGRSLRQFDLDTRLFKHRLSYLVYSPAFEALPADVKERLYQGLWKSLNATHEDASLNALPADERRTIIDILRSTKHELPGYWRAPAK